jgi:hypothetical protein
MTNKVDLDSIYDENKLIWSDTFRVLEKYLYKKCVKLQSVDMTEENKKDGSGNEVNGNEVNGNEKKQSGVKSVLVLNENIYAVISKVCARGLKPLVVNSCNDNYPIENVKNGLISPECELLRNSNFSTTIDELLYPLNGTDMLYSPSVTIFKVKKKRLAQPANIALLSMAPVKRPGIISIKNGEHIEETYSNESEKEKMRVKIENMFKLAVSRGHRAIIVTDFGCPEFNPLEKITQFFNEAMEKYPVKYVFFSIQDQENPFSRKSASKSFEVFHNNISRN